MPLAWLRLLGSSGSCYCWPLLPSACAVVPVLAGVISLDRGSRVTPSSSVSTGVSRQVCSTIEIGSPLSAGPSGWSGVPHCRVSACCWASIWLPGLQAIYLLLSVASLTSIFLGRRWGLLGISNTLPSGMVSNFLAACPLLVGGFISFLPLGVCCCGRGSQIVVWGKLVWSPIWASAFSCGSSCGLPLGLPSRSKGFWLSFWCWVVVFRIPPWWLAASVPGRGSSHLCFGRALLGVLSPVAFHGLCLHFGRLGRFWPGSLGVCLPFMPQA